MKLIETAVRWRHGTFALFCLLTAFGIISLLGLPLELQPGGDRPEITITTPYPGAGPAEVEDLITRPIEERVEGVPGLREVSSSSRSGSSRITLTFSEGGDMESRLLDVITRLQQVGSLPVEAGEPDVDIVSGSSSPMIWLAMEPQPGFQSDPNHYRDLVDQLVEPRLRQVEGVGDFIISGGTPREVEVRVDPQALAERNLTILDVTRTLRENNRDIRGGPLVVGRREYRVRTVSRSQSLEDIADFVLRRDASGAIYLRDVAGVEFGRQPQSSSLIFNNQPSVAIGVIRRVGANVPQVSQGIRQAISELEAQLDRQGEGIRFVYNYDENDYVTQSVRLVQENLISGAILAALVLLLFLGSMRTVAVVSLTIPTTMLTVFIVLSLMGRTLNIISLAALGFAAGMVVDNAIVVVENAFTHMQMGKRPLRASIDGTKEVAGGILGATLTNIAVFLPLAFIRGEVAQLYIDMAIAISAAAIFSMLAAVTLVPMLSGLFLDQTEAVQVMEGGTRGRNRLERAVGRTSAVFRAVQSRLENKLVATVRWSLGPYRMGRRLLVLSIPVLLLIMSVLLLPPADYLPDGNRNLVRWLAEPLPGTSIPAADQLSQAPREFLAAQPEILNVWSVNSVRFRAILATLQPESATGNGLAEMVDRMRAASGNFPGYRFLFPGRPSIFQDPGKEFEIDISGEDLDELSNFERQMMEQLRAISGVTNVRSNYVSGASELQVIPNRARLAEVGLSEAEVGAIVEAALGGRLASNFIDRGEELDVSVELKSRFVQTPEQLRQLPLYTRGGGQIQLSDVAEVRETTGPDVINRVNLNRAITLTVALSPTAPWAELSSRCKPTFLRPYALSCRPVTRCRWPDRLIDCLRQFHSSSSALFFQF